MCVRSLAGRQVRGARTQLPRVGGETDAAAAILATPCTCTMCAYAAVTVTVTVTATAAGRARASQTRIIRSNTHTSDRLRAPLLSPARLRLARRGIASVGASALLYRHKP